MALTFVDLIPVFLVFILYFMGMPIVYSLFGATFFYFLVIDTTSKPWLILQKVMNSTQSFSLLAIPFFIMAGSVMNFGGISEKLMVIFIFLLLILMRVSVCYWFQRYG